MKEEINVKEAIWGACCDCGRHFHREEGTYVTKKEGETYQEFCVECADKRGLIPTTPPVSSR